MANSRRVKPGAKTWIEPMADVDKLSRRSSHKLHRRLTLSSPKEKILTAHAAQVLSFGSYNLICTQFKGTGYWGNCLLNWRPFHGDWFKTYRHKRNQGSRFHIQRRSIISVNYVYKSLHLKQKKYVNLFKISYL